MAGREFTSARQSLSTDIFVKTMCLRSWTKHGVVKIPRDRQRAAAALTSSLPSAGGQSVIDAEVELLENEQEDQWQWPEDNLLEDVSMLNKQFEAMLSEQDAG